MRNVFSANRLFITFGLYLIIIIIPLGVMYYVGIRSMEDKRQQIEDSLKGQLRAVGEALHHDLSTEWEHFMREELLRKYYHYQTVTLPDEDDHEFEKQREILPERSPLYYTAGSLRNLTFQRGGLADPTRPSVGDIISNSLVGYFSYDPRARIFVTPYDTNMYVNPGPSTDRVEREERVQAFQDFLNKDLEPKMRDELDLTDKSSFRPNDVLRSLRASRKLLTREPKSKIENLDRLAENRPFQAIYKGEDPPLPVGYYGFRFFSMPREGNIYVVGFRAVLVDRGRLIVQGFIFNAVVLIQEAQVYLEEYQTDYGSVIVEETNPMLGQPLFDPFNFLVITYKTNGDQSYLRNYLEEKRRFYITMICLTIALVFSMLHLGTLIKGNVSLHRKKNNFISAVTHELKAPLTSIMMYAEMLEEGWAKGKEATYYHHIRWESERLSRLIRNILDYSGIERGTFKLQLAPLELDSFVTETLEALADWVDKNGLKLEVRIEATPMVLADKDSLSQVIYNLTDNTLKYGMGNDKPTMTVRVDELEEHAVFSIWDNGDGVPKEEEGKVFRRFYRIENEMTRESTGTGLGLALVKDLVEGNKGKIEYFRPFNDHGFGVRVTLPRLEDEELLALSDQEFA